MFCAHCQHDIASCLCPDIEERLRALRDTAIWPAAAQNLRVRALRRELDAEIDAFFSFADPLDM